MVDAGLWDPRDDKRLLKALLECGVEHEGLVDWEGLLPGRAAAQVGPGSGAGAECTCEHTGCKRHGLHGWAAGDALPWTVLPCHGMQPPADALDVCAWLGCRCGGAGT